MNSSKVQPESLSEQLTAATDASSDGVVTPGAAALAARTTTELEADDEEVGVGAPRPEDRDWSADPPQLTGLGPLLPCPDEDVAWTNLQEVDDLPKVAEGSDKTPAA